MIKKIVPLLSLLLLLNGCLGGLVTYSKRGMSPGDGVGTYHVKGRPIESTEEPDEVFARKQKLQIVPKDDPSKNGSLYNTKDARNNLFMKAPLGVGSYIEVLVDSTRLSESPPEETPTAQPAQPQAPDGEGSVDETLIKALPNLDAGKSNPVIIKKFNASIAKILDNGDYLINYTRTSKAKDSINHLNITARVPNNVIQKGDPIKTSDLYDVEWDEVQDEEHTVRESSGWEDEYTLRLSGFTEAKSKIALDLEEKRQQLEKVKQQLQTRINTLGQERNQVASERERVRKLKAELDETVKGYQTQIEELNEKVTEQQEALDRMRDDRQGSP